MSNKKKVCNIVLFIICFVMAFNNHLGLYMASALETIKSNESELNNANVNIENNDNEDKNNTENKNDTIEEIKDSNLSDKNETIAEEQITNDGKEDKDNNDKFLEPTNTGNAIVEDVTDFNGFKDLLNQPSNNLTINLKNDIIFDSSYATDLEIKSNTQNLVIDGLKDDGSKAKISFENTNYSLVLKGNNITLKNVEFENYNLTGIKVYTGENVVLENITLNGNNIANRGIQILKNSTVTVNNIETMNHKVQGILVERSSTLTLQGNNKHNDTQDITLNNAANQINTINYEDNKYVKSSETTKDDENQIINYSLKEIDITTFEELKKYSKRENVILNIKNDIIFNENLIVNANGITLRGDITSNPLLAFKLTDNTNAQSNVNSFIIKGENITLENLAINDFNNNTGIRILDSTNATIKNVSVISEEVNYPNGGNISDPTLFAPQYKGNIGIYISNSTVNLESITSKNNRNAGIQVRNGSVVQVNEINHYNDKIQLQTIDLVEENTTPNDKSDNTKDNNTTNNTNDIAIKNNEIIDLNEDDNKKYNKQSPYFGNITVNGEEKNVNITDYVIYVPVEVRTQEQLGIAILHSNLSIKIKADIDLTDRRYDMEIKEKNIIVDGLKDDGTGRHKITIDEALKPAIKGKNIQILNVDIEHKNSGTGFSVYGGENVILKNLSIKNINNNVNNSGIQVTNNAKNVTLENIDSSNHKNYGIYIVEGSSQVSIKGKNTHINDKNHLRIDNSVNEWTVDENSNYMQEHLKNDQYKSFITLQNVKVSDINQLKNELQTGRKRIIITSDLTFDSNIEITNPSIQIIGDTSYTGGNITVNKSTMPTLNLNGYGFSLKGGNKAISNFKIKGYGGDDTIANKTGLLIYASDYTKVYNLIFEPNEHTIQDPSNNAILKNSNKAVGLDIVASKNVELSDITTSNHSFQGIRIRNLDDKISEVSLNGKNQHQADEYELQVVASENREDYLSIFTQTIDDTGNPMYVEGDIILQGDRLIKNYYTLKDSLIDNNTDNFKKLLENKGAVVRLSNNITFEDLKEGDEPQKITIKDGSIIDGNNHTIDLNGSNYLEIKGKDITIKNVNIINSPENGLHLYNSKNVTLENVVLKGNKKYGVFVNGSKLTIKGDNNATEDNLSGGIWVTRSRTLLLPSQSDSELIIDGNITHKERNINIKISNLEMIIEGETDTRMQNNTIHLKNASPISNFNSKANSIEDYYDKYVENMESKKLSETTFDILLQKGVLKPDEKDRLFKEQSIIYMSKREPIIVTDKAKLDTLIDENGKKIGADKLVLVGDGKTDNTNNLRNLLDYSLRNNIELIFPEGIYVITDDIDISTLPSSPIFKSQANLKIRSQYKDRPAIIDGTVFLEGKPESEKRMLLIKEEEYHHSLNYLEIEDMIFNNVGLLFNGPHKKGISIINNGFVNGEFTRQMNTEGTKVWRIKMVPYVEVKNSKYIINENVFMRSEAHPGKGIATYATKFTEIKNNYFGDLKDIDKAFNDGIITKNTYDRANYMKKYSTKSTLNPSYNGDLNVNDYYDKFINKPMVDAPDGNFFTAINVFRYDKDVLIKENYFNITETKDVVHKLGYDVLIEGIGSNERRRDHIIYAKSYDGLAIVRNYFKGMENGSAGGVKLRNGNNVYVGSNFFNNVPLLTYIYGDLTKSETLLYNTVIHKNMFSQSSLDGKQGTILYYQSFRDGDNLEFTRPTAASPETEWKNAYGDVKAFSILNNEFNSDTEDGITISGRAKTAFNNNGFWASGNIYFNPNANNGGTIHNGSKNQNKVNYNTNGNYGLKESTKQELENIIYNGPGSASRTINLYQQYKDLDIVSYPPTTDKFYLDNLINQAQNLINKIQNENFVGDYVNRFTEESYNKLVITINNVIKVLNENNSSQDDINKAYDLLDKALKELKPGKQPAISNDGNGSNGGNSGNSGNGSNNGNSNTDLTNTDLNGAIISPEGNDTHIPYINGYPNSTFKPDNNITRAETSKIIYKLLEIYAKEYINGTSTNKFNDLTGSEWYAKYISLLAELNILEGYTDNTIKADNNITRAEFATLIYRLDALNDTSSQQNVQLKDVPINHWANKYISYSINKGYFIGYEDGSFKPNDNITRAEVVTVINRLTNRKPDENYINNNMLSSQFYDIKGHWAFYDIIESSITHNFIRANDKEIWKSITKK